MSCSLYFEWVYVTVRISYVLLSVLWVGVVTVRISYVLLSVFWLGVRRCPYPICPALCIVGGCPSLSVSHMSCSLCCEWVYVTVRISYVLLSVLRVGVRHCPYLICPALCIVGGCTSLSVSHMSCSLYCGWVSVTVRISHVLFSVLRVGVRHCPYLICPALCILSGCTSLSVSHMSCSLYCGWVYVTVRIPYVLLSVLWVGVRHCPYLTCPVLCVASGCTSLSVSHMSCSLYFEWVYVTVRISYVLLSVLRVGYVTVRISYVLLSVLWVGVVTVRISHVLLSVLWVGVRHCPYPICPALCIVSGCPSLSVSHMSCSLCCEWVYVTVRIPYVLLSVLWVGVRHCPYLICPALCIVGGCTLLT